MDKELVLIEQQIIEMQKGGSTLQKGVSNPLTIASESKEPLSRSTGTKEVKSSVKSVLNRWKAMEQQTLSRTTSIDGVGDSKENKIERLRRRFGSDTPKCVSCGSAAYDMERIMIQNQVHCLYF